MNSVLNIKVFSNNKKLYPFSELANFRTFWEKKISIMRSHSQNKITKIIISLPSLPQTLLWILFVCSRFHLGSRRVNKVERTRFRSKETGGIHIFVVINRNTTLRFRCQIWTKETDKIALWGLGSKIMFKHLEPCQCQFRELKTSQYFIKHGFQTNPDR